jgi:outer membrane receptor for ferrienterochelin and colicin
MTRSRLHRFLIPMLLLLWLGTPRTLAQITTGGISGKVVDDKGEPFPGVTVTARSAATGVERSASTGKDGRYSILGLPPATYVVQAIAGEYGTPPTTLVVNLGQTVSLVIALEPGGGLNETVQVVAAPPLLNTNKIELGTVVTESQIHAYPLINRDFNDLAQFAPGVKQAAGGQFDPTKKPGIYTPFTTGGTAGRNLNISIDGADNNDNVVGFFVQGYSAEAIQEFEVVQDQYKPEYGRSFGGVVNVITKSGSNDFNGSLFGTFRNQGMRAANFSEVMNGADKADSQRSAYGFAVGGSIVKEKLFYFVSAEKQDEATPSTLNSLLTDYSGTEPPGYPFQIAKPGTSVDRSLNRKLLSVRLDYHASPNHLLWFRWAYDNAGFANDQGGTLTDPSNDGSSQNKTWSAIANWQWVIGSRMVNELKVHTNDFVNQITSSSPDPLLTLSYDNFSLGRNGNTPQATYQKKFQVRDDLTWVAGKHSLKAGLEWIRVNLDDSNFGPPTYPTVGFGFNHGVTPAQSFVSGDLNGNGVDDGVEAIANVNLIGAALNPGTKYEQYATYLQDDWDLSSRWRVSLGLRVDRDQGIFNDAAVGINRQIYECFANPNDAHLCGLDPNTPNPSNGPRGFSDFHRTFPGDQTNIAPRLGFVYNVKGASKDVIRGSWGLFYDRLLDNLVVFMRSNLSPYKSPTLPALQGCDTTTDPTCSASQILAGSSPVSGYAPLPADFTLANWEDPASGLQAWLAGLSSVQGPATFNDSVAMPSPDWKTPYTSSFSVGWGHAFSSKLTLDTNLIYRRGYRQVFNPAFGGQQSGRDAPFPVVVDPATGTATYPGFVFIISTEGKSEYTSLQSSLKGHYTNFDFGVNVNLSRALGTQDTGSTYTSGGSFDLFQGGNIKFTGGDIDSEWGQISGDQLFYSFLYGTYRFPHGFETSMEITYGTRVAFNGYAGLDLNQDGFDSGEEYAGKRGSGRGDDLFNVNLRAAKRFNTGKGTIFELYADVFNVFNRTNYGFYVDHRQLIPTSTGNEPNPNYEKPFGDTVTPPLTAQLGFRFTF